MQPTLRACWVVIVLVLPLPATALQMQTCDPTTAGCGQNPKLPRGIPFDKDPRPAVKAIPTNRAITQVTAVTGVDRPGADYRTFSISALVTGTPPARRQAAIQQCRAACLSETQCRAFAVGPAVALAETCWLKAAVPAAVANPAIASGVKVRYYPR